MDERKKKDGDHYRLLGIITAVVKRCQEREGIIKSG